MAIWDWREIRWTDRPPNRRELARLKRLLLVLDYDAPVEAKYTDTGLREDGMAGQWRCPTLSLRGTLAVLHIMGFPCRGREVPKSSRNCWDGLDGEGWEAMVEAWPKEWVESKPLLTGRDAKQAMFARGWSRKLDRHLPIRRALKPNFVRRR